MGSFGKRSKFVLGMAVAIGLAATVLFARPTAARSVPRVLPAGCAAKPSSAIQHLVVIIQENHSFDSYFGSYCKAAVGSNPACTNGPECCEASPPRDPGSRRAPVLLTDEENASFSPDHSRGCEESEINGGKMDHFVEGACGNPRNFAVADPKVMAPYWTLARNGALADRYFQPVAGASSSNDMYFARASYVFTDNEVMPLSVGAKCGGGTTVRRNYTDATIGDLLLGCDVPWAFYAEGYADMQQAESAGRCPTPGAECRAHSDAYPCTFDPSDIPFEYYPTTQDNPRTMKDFTAFGEAVAHGNLPAVSFIKALGFRTEHPGDDVTVTDGETFVAGVVKQVMASPYAANTLILITMDESGGYFDHVAPPAASRVDHQPYGPRLPLIAVGRFVRAGEVSHVTMEHSSIVKFIEWNWLGGKTGQLGTRDGEVNNIGSILDPVATVTEVPSN